MKKIVYKGKFLEVSEEYFNGKPYERVKLRPGIKVLPVKDNKILFIREYRVIEQQTSVKLISGWMDKEGKSPLEIAKEELAEEAGLEAEKWYEFHYMNTDNFTVENKVWYYVAENPKELEEKIENPDHDIVEELLWLSEEEFWKMCDRNEINWFSDNFVAAMLFRRLREKNETEK